MQKFAHDEVVPDVKSTDTKKQQVAFMFDNIAHKYDFMNRFMSGRVDVLWRKKTIQEISSIRPQLILDVATGTADVALLTYDLIQPKKIIGIDISNGMLSLGREKVKTRNLDQEIELQIGDSEKLNFDDNYFDAITVAYGVRNFENLRLGISELYRVLKPGGKISILEASKPSNKIVKLFSNFYTLKIIPFFGKLFSGNKNAYIYLNNSIQAFPEGKDFLNILIEAGFTQTYLKSLSLGVCTIYCGSK